MDLVSLIGDTFVVRSNYSYIIFSPFSGKITRIPCFPEIGSSVFVSLSDAGFFKQPPDSIKKESLDSWTGFRSLTLLVTRRCNLACVYCYATAKLNGRSMSLDTAMVALDYFYKQLKGNTLRITFHGGGEPTLEWILMKEVVAKSQFLAKRDEKETRFVIVTNGTNNKIIPWLIENKFGISISADGPPSIQNRNRPFANGDPSSKAVEKSIQHLVKCDYPFTIRLTFSSADSLSDIVKYFGSLGVKSLHIEPLFPFGRFYGTDNIDQKKCGNICSPSGGEFVDAFLKGMDVAKSFGMKITNSHLSHLMRWSGYFCGSASGRSMIVTDDGFVSGCLEVVDSNDPNFETFRLGRIHSNSGEVVIDNIALGRLQSRHGDILDHCKDCFARYVCSGGCAVKTVRASGNFMGRDLPYCVFTKNLIPKIIEQIANLSKI